MIMIRRSSLSTRDSAATMSDCVLEILVARPFMRRCSFRILLCWVRTLSLVWCSSCLDSLSWSSVDAKLDRATPGRHARTNAATDEATMRWARGTAPRVVRGLAISTARTYLRIRTRQPRLGGGRAEDGDPIRGRLWAPSVPHACLGQGAG